MKMFIYTVLTALLTSGWWSFFLWIGNVRAWVFPFVTIPLILVTVVYLAWMFLAIMDDWNIMEE